MGYSQNVPGAKEETEFAKWCSQLFDNQKYVQKSLIKINMCICVEPIVLGPYKAIELIPSGLWLSEVLKGNLLTNLIYRRLVIKRIVEADHWKICKSKEFHTHYEDKNCKLFHVRNNMNDFTNVVWRTRFHGFWPDGREFQIWFNMCICNAQIDIKIQLQNYKLKWVANVNWESLTLISSLSLSAMQEWSPSRSPLPLC